jgi:hypothetical protein
MATFDTIRGDFLLLVDESTRRATLTSKQKGYKRSISKILKARKAVHASGGTSTVYCCLQF